MSHVRTLALAGTLLLVLAATRSHQVPGLDGPGDATLAMFFLGGLWLTRLRWLAVFLGTAALTDYCAIQSGVSAWCVTPAYGFLIPAYGALWLAGRACRGASLTAMAGALAGGVAVFFVISNAAFYTTSGYFGGMGALDYAAGVAPYLPGYLAGAFVYAGAGLLVAHLTRLAARRTAAPSEARMS